MVFSTVCLVWVRESARYYKSIWDVNGNYDVASIGGHYSASGCGFDLTQI